MKTYTIKMKYFTDTFFIRTARYGNGTLAVIAESATESNREVLSINLEAYGLVPDSADQFYVKNYSEHEGLADALVAAGVAEKVPHRKVRFGYGSAYLMKLVADAK